MLCDKGSQRFEKVLPPRLLSAAGWVGDGRRQAEELLTDVELLLACGVLVTSHSNTPLRSASRCSGAARAIAARGSTSAAPPSASHHNIARQKEA